MSLPRADEYQVTKRRILASLGVWPLVAALATAAVVLTVQLHDVARPQQPLPVPAAALALAFLLAELGRLHLEVRRHAVTVTLSDVALVLALFTVAPDDAVLLRALTCLPLLAWLYRASPARLAVNAVNLLVETAVCAGVLAVLAAGAPPSDPRAWVSCFVAVQVSGALSGLVVNAAIALTGDEQRLREIVEQLLVGAAVLSVTSLLGVASAVMLAGAHDARWLLVALYALGLGAYRGYARLRERKAGLEAVHSFSRRLDASQDPQDLLRTVLVQVPDLIGARRVEVVLLNTTGDGSAVRLAVADGVVRIEDLMELLNPALAGVISSVSPRLLTARTNDVAERALLAQHGAGQAMLTPLVSESRVVGVLLALDRLAQTRPFRADDLVLFETLALHSGVALGSARLIERLRHDVNHDRLTGLLNRAGLLSRVQAGDGTAGAVVLLNLIGFAEVNSALGHSAGDDLLRSVAGRLPSVLPADGLLARLEGDEFGVYLPEQDLTGATAAAERLLGLLARPVDLHGVPVSLEAAVGLAAGPPDQPLLHHAKIAMHVTKGREGIVAYQPGLEPPSGRRLQIATDLRRVLADAALASQVEVHYQPKATLETGRVGAVEALVRWRQPDSDLISPAEFIPVVESTGLVRPLTLHVLDTALADAGRWLRAGRPLVVAVNLSARNLQDPEMPDDIQRLLDQHAVPADLLTLEITESAVMDDPQRAQELLEEIARLGVRLSVDDFGTGYSSLAYLARLPVSEVKVDRTFVSKMTSDPRDAAVVRSVVGLGHSLGLKVVAEGVEDQSCWDALVDAGCDTAQGFLLSRALPAADLVAWLAARDVPQQRRDERVRTRAEASCS